MRRALVVAAALMCAARAGADAAEPMKLSLAEAVRIAATQSPATLSADQRTIAASSREEQERSVLLPSVTGTASDASRTYNPSTFGFKLPTPPGVAAPTVIGPFGIVDARLSARQTLFDVAGWKRWKAAGVGVDASRADRNATSESAAAAAALAYLDVAHDQALLAARNADFAIANELLSLAESQQKAGVAPGIDVTRARTQVAVARIEVVLAQNRLDRAQIDLARTLGLNPAQRFSIADTLSPALGASLAPEAHAEADTFAAAHRPDLIAADARVQRARAERSATGAERLPRIDLAGDYGASGQTFGDAVPTHEVSVAVTLPILDGLRREGRIAEQTAALTEDQIAARDLRDRIHAEVGAALLNLESGRQLIDVAQERLALAEQELSEARDRFVNGVAGNLDVINAQSGLDRAREAEIDARHATAVARVELARATGVVESVR
jgi:outer membrane protein